MTDPREERIAVLGEALDELRTQSQEISDKIKKIFEERKSLLAELDEERMPEMEIGEIIRRILVADFEYTDSGFNPYRESNDRYVAWATQYIPAGWMHEYSRWVEGGDWSRGQITPTLLPRHPKDSHFVDTAEVASGLEQIILGTRIALPHLDEEDQEIVFGTMTNDLSASGIITMRVLGDKARVVKTTYGRDRNLIEGTIVDCLEYLSLNEWYGDPEKEEDDYSW